MSYLFSAATVFAVIGWAMLICRRYSRALRLVVMAVILGLAGLYTAGCAAYVLEGGRYPLSLEGLRVLSQSSVGLLAIWTHLLAVDLAAGLWECADAAAIGMGRPQLAICLALTMLQGPVGVSVYIVLRKLR